MIVWRQGILIVLTVVSSSCTSFACVLRYEKMAEQEEVSYQQLRRKLFGEVEQEKNRLADQFLQQKVSADQRIDDMQCANQRYSAYDNSLTPDHFMRMSSHFHFARRCLTLLGIVCLSGFPCTDNLVRTGGGRNQWSKVSEFLGRLEVLPWNFF